MVHIHRPRQNIQEVLPEQPKSSNIFYGIRGLEAPTVGNDVFAQQEDAGTFYVYRALAYRNRLFNPYNDTKVRDFEWKAVSKPVFDNYLQFLKTQREAYLSEAEREYSNG